MGIIKNGMTVVVRKDIEVPIDLRRLQNSQLPFDLNESGGSSVVKDHDMTNPIGELVFVKGIGLYSLEYFEEYNDTSATETPTVYSLIIQTENVFRDGGQYHCYDNVEDHVEESNGVRITLGDAEFFHPWSYDGGIRTLIKQTV